MKPTPDKSTPEAKIDDPKNSKDMLEHTLRALEAWANLSPEERDTFIQELVDSCNGRANDTLANNEAHKKR